MVAVLQLDHEVAFASAAGGIEGLDDDGRLFTLEPASEFILQLNVQFLECAGSPAGDICGNARGHSRGRGPAAGAEGEDMSLCEGGLAHQCHGCGEVVIGFAGESGDYIGRNCGSVEASVEFVHAAAEVVEAVLTTHALQYAVRAGLQGQVQMGGDVLAGAENVQQAVGYVGWFEGAEADAAQAGDSGDLVEEVGKVIPVCRVPAASSSGVLAIGTEKDAGQDYFAVACLHEGAGLCKDRFYIFVTNMGPYFGYDTIGAECIAAVLDFQKGTCLS